MKFLKPTTDIAFKKLFGSQERQELTISFLNSVLGRSEGELITTVVINDNANLPETLDKKISFVDINCTDQTGKHYIVEMQVVNEYDFIARSQYYASFFLSRQLEAGKEYRALVPVIFIGVVCYDLLDEDECLNHYFLTNSKTGKVLSRLLEFHFVETKKFNKSLDQLITPTDKWLYFIKNASDLEQIPTQLQKSEELIKAFHVIEKALWSSKELESYKAEEEAVGREQRQQEGAREEGKAEGKAEGKWEEKLYVAQNMLARGFDIDTVASITGLSIEQIKELKKAT